MHQLTFTSVTVEDPMHQKFQICRDAAKTRLSIREFGVTDSHLNFVQFESLKEKNFSLLCETTYDNVAITDSIAAGLGTLISTLRTRNFFPNRQLATKIAEAVVEVCASPRTDTIELYFDNQDLMTRGLPVLAQS
jgi:hypothetical protein